MVYRGHKDTEVKTSVETLTLTSASFEDLVREMIVRLGEDPVREGWCARRIACIAPTNIS